MNPNLLTGNSLTGRSARILGLGSYLPETVITNRELPKHLDTSDEWIVQRTGIKKRHFVSNGQQCSDLAIIASQRALTAASIKPENIDLLVLATSTSDQIYPATAAKVQAALGIPPCPFMDVQAVCAGFTYALSIANNMLLLGQATTALVIGSDVNSAILDNQDRSTYVLFGDGAGAMVLRAENYNAKMPLGIISCRLGGNGYERDKLYVDGGVSSNRQIGHVKMQGREVFRYAVEKMSEVVLQCLAEQNLNLNEVDWYVPHQANLRIIDAVAEKLKLPKEKIIITLQEHANISAATIPVAMAQAVAEHKFQSGQLIALSALGGGFAWGGALLRWG